VRPGRLPRGHRTDWVGDGDVRGMTKMVVIGQSGTDTATGRGCQMPDQSVAIQGQAGRMGGISARLAAGLVLLALGACTSFVPSSGPRLGQVTGGASVQTGDPGTPEHPKLSYVLVNLDPDNVIKLAAEPPDAGFGFGAGALGAGPAAVRIGVGDIVSATVFEAQAGGLFIPQEPGTSTGNFVNFPPQQINTDGIFMVPFGGAIHAVGMTPAQLERAIAASIANRALEPQVIVTVQERRSHEVNVTGDVNASTRFGIDPGGERLLGAISRAGGPRFPTYESMVTLQRGGQDEQASLADIVANPRENIELRQGDTVIVTHQPRYFLALGAVGQAASITQLNQRYPFEDARLSLADAIARAGGLADVQANPTAVFLFRFEHTPLLREMGVPLPADAPAEMPTVYRTDFTNASTLFLAREFPMRNNDMIFVSNAPLTDYAKFLSIILPFAQSGSNFRAFNP
jgi:polysaccharide export outer membrane protein